MAESPHSFDISGLEAEIEQKLRALTVREGQTDPALIRLRRQFQTRVMRSGSFRRRPIRIHARNRLTRRDGCYVSPDQLAHYLSMHASRLPEESFRTINEILLLPQLIASESSLLTHIYVPSRRILAMYLYPRRFNRVDYTGAQKPYHSRMESNNMPVTGLFGTVLQSLAALEGSEQNLHKFIIPTSALHPADMDDLEYIHDLYAGTADL